MKLIKYLAYFKWNFSLDRPTIIYSNLQKLNNTVIYSKFIGKYENVLLNIEYINENTTMNFQSPNKECKYTVIDPGHRQNNINKKIKRDNIIIFLTNEMNSKFVMYCRYAKYLKTYSNFLIFNFEQSREILKAINKKKEITISYTQKEPSRNNHLVIIFICIMILMASILLVLYYVRSLYVKTLTNTETDLRKLKVTQYKDVFSPCSDECSICISKFKYNDWIRILLCNHIFHKKCVDKWLCEQSSRCPYCRCINTSYEEI